MRRYIPPKKLHGYVRVSKDGIEAVYTRQSMLRTVRAKDITGPRTPGIYKATITVMGNGDEHVEYKKEIDACKEYQRLRRAGDKVMPRKGYDWDLHNRKGNFVAAADAARRARQQAFSWWLKDAGKCKTDK